MPDPEALTLAKIASNAIADGHPVNRLPITARRYDGSWSRSKIARDAAADVRRRVLIAHRAEQKRRAA
jgi:hypothetical protein